MYKEYLFYNQLNMDETVCKNLAEKTGGDLGRKIRNLLYGKVDLDGIACWTNVCSKM